MRQHDAHAPELLINGRCFEGTESGGSKAKICLRQRTRIQRREDRMRQWLQAEAKDDASVGHQWTC